MSDPTPFDNDDNKQETPAQTQNDPFADKLKEIRNENGEPKYKDIETALGALRSSQEYIPQLKSENEKLNKEIETLREELSKMGSIDDFVNKLNPPKKEDTPPPTKETTEVHAGMSEEQVAQLFEQRLAAREATAAQAANLDKVVNHLTQTHGENAAEFIKQKSKELGTTPDELKELAKTKPQMVMTLLSQGEKQAPKHVEPRFSSSAIPKPTEDMPKFDRTPMSGGMNTDEVLTQWRAVRDHTYKKLNVES